MADSKSDDIKKAQREYHREWRKKNPDRVAKIQERFWTRKAAELRNQDYAAKHEQRISGE